MKIAHLLIELIPDLAALLGLMLLGYGLWSHFGLWLACIVVGALLVAAAVAGTLRKKRNAD